jgi:hypothetical protein
MVYKSLGIDIQHFDTRTQKKLDIKESFKNTVAEYLFPDTTFTLGTVYDKTTPEELRRVENQTLEFTNGKKFYWADAPVRERLFPNASDGAAYGSLVFTSCLNFTEVENVRVLVIDHETGENPLGLDPQEAKKLVGDCWCRSDPSLHERVGGKDNKPFQFRLGIRPQENSPVARIAKGTVCPIALSNIGSGYDLILPTSAFKGRKGEQQQAIAPGEYQLTLGIGIKSHANYGTHSLGPQVLVNFPLAVKDDILPKLSQVLEQLETFSQNPLALVEDYLTSTQECYKYRLLDRLEIEENLLENDDLEALMDLVEQENQEVLYHLLKKDSSAHRQLLEHPKIVASLNDHLQNRYREIATGRAIKFKGALLQPHPDLAEREFCDPTLPDGEEVIVTRSPLVNSNGVIVLTNRHLRDIEHIQGVAWMNALSAATYLQGDFDGDRVAYAESREYPTLAAEVKKKHQSDLRYADVVKKDKIPYTGSFEEIALSASDNQIGVIANLGMKAIALEQEISVLPDAEREVYLQQLSSYFSSLWQKDKETGDRVLPPYLAPKEAIVSQLESLKKADRPNEEKLNTVRQILHELVGEIGNELQVAVDGPKSALRPDRDILKACQSLTDYREVSWLKDYKAKETYRDRPLSSNNYSPVDLMVRPVNCSGLQT